MTNPTSYTDEQVRSLFSDDVREMVESLLADRQRLRAEVEALRNGAARLASDWVRHATSGASRSPLVHDDCAEQLRDLLEETRATPNETKGAKS